MSVPVVKRPRVLRDLDDAAAYIQQQSSPKRAIRFLRSADSTFVQVARMPGIGTPYEPNEPLYAGLRYLPITRHRKYLVFYRPVPGGIEVLRVLHGTRDLQSILAAEFRSKHDDDETSDSE